MTEAPPGGRLASLAVELRAACAAEIDGRTVGHFNGLPWLRQA
ncbi:hypothetical protein [Streptomyces sp. NPDC048111]